MSIADLLRALEPKLRDNAYRLGAIDELKVLADEVERALLAAYEAMNYMGDILNDMDAVTDADEAYLSQRFDVVRSVLGIKSAD